MAEPPIRCRLNWKLWPPFAATRSRTWQAASTTSGPMPPPGSSAMFARMGFLHRIDAELEAVGQRRPGGGQDVGAGTDRAPAPRSVARVDEHTCGRGSGALAVEDAHPVVD